MSNKDLENEIQKSRKIIKVLLITIVSLLLLTLFSITKLMPNNLELFAGKVNENNFLNPARHTFSERDIIVNFQRLRDYLNQFERDQNTSIYFEYLNTGASIVISKDAEFYPASLLKVPIAMAVMKKIENGDWKLSNQLVITNQDKDDSFGDLYKKPIGTPLTIEFLLKEMLLNSDNTARSVFARNLEVEELRSVHKHLGFEQFFSEEGKISAKRYSVVLRSLYNASYLSDEHSQKILKTLSATPFNNFLDAGISDEVKFSHKIGIHKNEQVFLDSGIAYVPKRPYILTVMIKTDDENSAKARMKEISEQVYNYVVTYSEQE